MTKTRNRGKPYTLYPKTTKHGPVFYVEFRQSDGKFGSAKCSGQRTKGAAETWAIEYLKAGQVTTRENITFGGFAKDFFNIDGQYAKNKKARNKKFSEGRLEGHTSHLKVHLIPAFEKYKLSDIDYDRIARLQLKLLEKGRAGDTVNSVVDTLKILLTEAYKKKLIQTIPLIEKVSVNSIPRGVLTMAEVKRLFSLPWDNEYAKVGNFLAASTGMRQGEIVALRRSAVHKDHVDVFASWNQLKQFLKGTKTGKPRFVPIPSKVYSELIMLMEVGKWTEDNDFVFENENRDKPMNPEILRDSLYDMLDRIGIDEEERTERQICFHSWRHFFNSFLVNANISTFKVQALTGHQSDSMTKNYYHPDEYGDVLQLQEAIFPNSY